VGKGSIVAYPLIVGEIAGICSADYLKPLAVAGLLLASTIG